MISKEELRSKVIDVLKQVYDPEIPVNIYDLGLIYEIRVDDENNVRIKMTLTAVGCPIAGILTYQVKEAVKRKVSDVKEVDVELVWDPPWTPKRITPEGREILKKLFGYDLAEEWEKRS